MVLLVSIGRVSVTSARDRHADLRQSHLANVGDRVQ